MKTHVIYHRDADGFASAFCAWCVLGSGGVTYRSIQYGEPFPDIPDGSRVFILDFSWPDEAPGAGRAGLTALAARCHLTVLDHHETAEKELEGLEFAEFDMLKSGVHLAWDYFSRIGNAGGDAPAAELLAGMMPVPLHWIGTRDLWAHIELDEQTRGDIEALNAYLSLRGFLQEFHGGREGSIDEPKRPSFEAWHSLCGDFPPHTLSRAMIEGRIVLDYERALVKRLAHTAVRQVIGEDEVPVVNSPILQSEICHHLLETQPRCDFAACYYDRKGRPGEPEYRRIYSLRSLRGGDVDVAAIAKRFNGGGHKHAAGFTEIRPKAALRADNTHLTTP